MAAVFEGIRNDMRLSMLWTNMATAKKIANQLQEKCGKKKTLYTNITVVACSTEWLKQAATEVRPRVV